MTHRGRRRLHLSRPAAGTSCTDTSDFFDYTLSDQNTPARADAGTDTGRVTIAIAGCVWYVNNNARPATAAPPAPRSTRSPRPRPPRPPTTRCSCSTATTRRPATAARLTMKAGQRLIGEARRPRSSAATPCTRPTRARTRRSPPPAPTSIDLDDGNEVRGLNIDPQGAGGGIAGSTGDAGGTIDDVNIIDTGTSGTQPGLELDGTTGHLQRLQPRRSAPTARPACGSTTPAP